MKLRELYGFTMLELIIVILVLAILIVLSIPQFEKAKEKGYAVEAINIMGAVRRESIRRYTVGDQNHEGAGILCDIIGYYPPSGLISYTGTVSTANWDYAFTKFPLIPQNSGGDQRLVAERKEGPYKGIYIILDWHLEAGTNAWSGTHPGVPKS